MAIILTLLVATFIGWLGSLTLRSDSNERIIIDMPVGALGDIIMALSPDQGSTFDRFVASFLSAFVAMAGIWSDAVCR